MFNSSLLRLRHFAFAFFVGLLFVGNASANAPLDYGNEYGLFVTAENRNTELTVDEGIQILESYFYGTPLNRDLNPVDPLMNQRDLLLAFELMRADFEGDDTLAFGDTDIYHEAWLRYRRHNLLPEVQVTYGTVQEFLYRFEVSKRFNGLAFRPGLVLDESEISVDNFKSIPEVGMILEELQVLIRELRLEEADDEVMQALLPTLESHYLAFEAVEARLIEMEHPVNKIPNLPEDIKQKILDNDLNQVMGSISYNYSTNIYNRQFNVVKGAMQLNGRVFQPGEEISFTDVLAEGEGGLNGYLSGWAIIKGEEEWTYGGGLCGSATVFFTPSWEAGLEIVERRGHSSYYLDLYPEESFWRDATIFFGQTDVIMRNNTESPVLYYVSDDPVAKEITLYVIGNSPYVDITIDDPIVYGNSAESFRHMTLPDGTVVTDSIYTSYARIY